MDLNLKWLAVLAVVIISPALGEWYNTYTGQRITDQRAAELAANGLIPFCAINVKNCSKEEPRRLDYTCNNLDYPTRGAVLTPFLRMLPAENSRNGGLTTAKSGRPLPNARALRVAILPDGRVPSKRFTHLITAFMLVVITDITTVHDTVNYPAVTRNCCLPGGSLDPRCIPIQVSAEDVHLRMSSVRCLNLTRAITYQNLGCIPDTLPPERINTNAPLLDLNTIYGSEEYRARSVMGENGRLQSELVKDKEWPIGNGALCINNINNETRCNVYGDQSGNALLGGNVCNLWFFRSHNRIADALHKLNPCWSSEKLYQVAKDINIAMEQQMIVYELWPTLIDPEYLERHGAMFPGHGHIEDYDHTLQPGTYIEFVLNSRWFHTLQEGRMKMYDSHGKQVNEIPIVDMTLRTGILTLNNTIEGVTQGFIRQPSASSDYIIDPEMGERALGRLQRVTDVMSADIMKNRDLGIPSYNKYRALYNLPVAKNFDDLRQWMPKQQVEAIESAYEDIDDVELLVGILGEKPMKGSVMGPTLAGLMTEQMLRWRRSDRFWFENTAHAGALTPKQLKEIRKARLARLICDHGDNVHKIQPSPLLLPGPDNPMLDCSVYPKVDLSAWRDDTCENHGGHDNTDSGDDY